MLGYLRKLWGIRKSGTYDCESIIGADTDERGVFLKQILQKLSQVKISSILGIHLSNIIKIYRFLRTFVINCNRIGLQCFSNKKVFDKFIRLLLIGSYSVHVWETLKLVSILES